MKRTPATGDTPTYPTLSEHADSRRRFLKLCALSSAAATLGFQLTGCPSGPGPGPGPNTDWIPWNEPVAVPGGMAMPVGTPVAVVVSGAPIAVVFSDGVKANIVVAGVVTPMAGTNVKADCTSRAQAHSKLVQDTAKQHPSSVLSDAKALEALETQLMQKLNASLGSGYMDQVSVAKEKAAPAPNQPPSDPPARAPSAPSDAGGAGPPASLAPPPPPAEGAAPPAKPKGPTAKQIWTPCRTAGCTSCG